MKICKHFLTDSVLSNPQQDQHQNLAFFNVRTQGLFLTYWRLHGDHLISQPSPSGPRYPVKIFCEDNQYFTVRNAKCRMFRVVITCDAHYYIFTRKGQMCLQNQTYHSKSSKCFQYVCILLTGEQANQDCQTKFLWQRPVSRASRPRYCLNSRERSTLRNCLYEGTAFLDIKLRQLYTKSKCTTSLQSNSLYSILDSGARKFRNDRQVVLEQKWSIGGKLLFNPHRNRI